MSGDVIKSFLVSLGFGVDDADLAKFNKSIAEASKKVTALAVATEAAAAGIFFGISKIAEGFEQIGYEYRIIAPALNKALQLRQALLHAYQAAGINLTKAVQQSVLFNFSLAKTKFALEAIYKSVGVKFLPLLTKQMDNFRKTLYANMPRIQHALESFVTFIFKAFEALNILGGRLYTIFGRVYDFLKLLDKATGGWSTVILGAVAAWRLLNLSFLATPLGMIIAGLTTLLALWDDFKTFKEGGQSLINWGSDATKLMVGLAAAIGSVALVFGTLIGAMKAYALVQAGIDALLLANPFGLVLVAITALISAITYLDSKWKLFGGNVVNFLTGIGGKLLDFVAGTPNISANVNPANSPVANPLTNPVGSNIQNSQINQHVSQETSIVVQGSSDATATGRAVAGEQQRVNFDLARNTKGAIKG